MNEEEPSHKPDPDRHDRPQVVFETAYVLTREQEDKLLTHAFDRLEELEEQLGRKHIRGAEWWSGDGDTTAKARASFMGKRELFNLMYENDVRHRKRAGTIFEKSNMTIPITRRIITQLVARANAHFFGSDPWFEVDGQGVEDIDLGKATDRWTKHKFKEGRIRSQMEAAVEGAFVRGQTIVKTVFDRRDDIFRTKANVLMNPETGEPFVAQDGDYVFQGSEQHRFEEGGQRILERDGVTVLPDGDLAFEERLLVRRERAANKPKAETVYFRDFLCPLEAESIDSADLVAHCYQVPVAELADQWNRVDQGLTDEESVIQTQNAVQAILEMTANRGDQSLADDAELGTGSRHRAERSEDTFSREAGASAYSDRAMSNTVEFWLRWDADGDGIMENIVLIADRETRMPIAYDYARNVTPDGRRPFRSIRIHPIDGRWYGMGIMEVFEHIQKAVDLLWNRLNVAQTTSGRFDIFRSHLTKEGMESGSAELNTGKTYTPIDDDIPIEKIFSFVELPNVKVADVNMMFQFYLQLALNMSGVQSANDAGMAGLASAKTATSVNNIHEAGMEIFGQLVSHLFEGVDDTVNALAELNLVNMDAREVYAFMENGAMVFAAIKRDDVQSIRLNVRVTMTKYKGEQAKIQLADAIKQTERYYLQRPDVQVTTAGLYRALLRENNIPDADSYIQPTLSQERFELAMQLLQAFEAQGMGGEGAQVMGREEPGAADLSEAPEVDTHGPGGGVMDGSGGTGQYSAQMRGGINANGS